MQNSRKNRLCAPQAYPETFFLKCLQGAKIYGKGSHVRFRHSDGRRTVIPVHGNEKLGKGLLREILKQIKLSKEEYDKLIGR